MSQLPKPKTQPDDPEQFRRFQEAARELGADDAAAGEAFRHALGRILPPRKPGEPVPRGGEQAKPKGSRRKDKFPD